MKRRLEYLKRPYPKLDMPWWKSTLIACGVVFMLFALFEPFGIDSRLGFYKWVIIGGLFMISALCVNLPGLLLPGLLGKEAFEEKNWTVGKNILYNLSILLLIAIGNYLFLCTFFLSNGFRLSSFLIITMNTFFIGIFPVGLLTVLTENRNLSRHLKEVAGMNEQIRGGSPATVEPSEAAIILPDGVKDTFELEVDQFVLAGADGNYIKIVYRYNEKLLQRTLRLTMKQVEDAFTAYPYVQKCHRAFLVNLRCIENIKGNSQGYRLVLKDWAEEIPVSRACNKEIREKVEHFFHK